MKRYGYLDTLRGMAVIWMIIFHSAYDLRVFNFVSWNFSEGFWYGFPRLIAFTFLFCVGISLNITHARKINWPHLRKRSLKLGSAALIISTLTFIFFRQNWIFFGTLHCIFAGSILGALIVAHRKLAWGLLGLILILQYGVGFDIKWVSNIIQKPSMDFIPIYPWFWAVLLGIVLEPYLSKNRHLTEHRSPKILKLLGTHSLKIYLLHQPFIYGLIWLLS
jgi:uncharacterized membrane protein